MSKKQRNIVIGVAVLLCFGLIGSFLPDKEAPTPSVEDAQVEEQTVTEQPAPAEASADQFKAFNDEFNTAYSRIQMQIWQKDDFLDDATYDQIKGNLYAQEERINNLNTYNDPDIVIMKEKLSKMLQETKLRSLLLHRYYKDNNQGDMDASVMAMQRYVEAENQMLAAKERLTQKFGNTQ